MRPRAATSRLAIASLLLALAGARPAFAQAGGMPIPLAPSASAMAGLLLLPLIPLALLLSQSDATRLRALDAREDWDGMTALASRRLAEHPGDPIWHEVRGRALQRQGRCADAVADLRLAFDSRAGQPALQPGTLFDTGMLLGLCQMAVQDFPGAARTMERLAAMAPERWEPAYHLGVIRAQQGDMDGARAVLPALRAKSQARADSLQAYLAATTRARAQPAAGADPASQPGFLHGGRLPVGPIVLDLPAGTWFEGPATQRTVRGSRGRPMVSGTTDVRVVTARAYALDNDGSVAAAAAFSTNPQQAFGTSYWNVDDPCAAPAILYRYRFSRSLDQPACAYVRIVDPATALASADVQGAVQAAAHAGADWKDPAYELRYAGYGLDRVVEATVLVPMHYFAGDMAAVQWVHALAAQLKPLARRPSNRRATLPALLAPR